MAAAAAACRSYTSQDTVCYGGDLKRCCVIPGVYGAANYWKSGILRAAIGCENGGLVSGTYPSYIIHESPPPPPPSGGVYALLMNHVSHHFTRPLPKKTMPNWQICRLHWQYCVTSSDTFQCMISDMKHLGLCYSGYISKTVNLPPNWSVVG